MQASATATIQDGNDSIARQPSHDTRIRCLVVSPGAVDATGLAILATKSRYVLDVLQPDGFAEAKAHLMAGAVDILVLGADLATGAEANAAQALAKAAQSMAVPTIVMAAGPSDEAAMHAVRWGASDYLAHEDVVPARFEEAIERALARSATLPEEHAAQLSNLKAENDSLRRTSLRNMRLLKSQVLPVLSFAWKAMQQQAKQEGAAVGAPKLASQTRNILALIDDTVVNAAAFRINEHSVAVDLSEVLADIVHDESNGLSVNAAHIRIAQLPILLARRSHLAMLFEELLLSAVRAVPLGQLPDIQLGSGLDPDGNPIIVLTEKGLHLSARKQALAQRNVNLQDAPVELSQDAHAWSLCERLVKKCDGEMRISATPDQGSRVQIRFPKAMLIPTRETPEQTQATFDKGLSERSPSKIA